MASRGESGEPLLLAVWKLHRVNDFRDLAWLSKIRSADMFLAATAQNRVGEEVCSSSLFLKDSLASWRLCQK